MSGGHLEGGTTCTTTPAPERISDGLKSKIKFPGEGGMPLDHTGGWAAARFHSHHVSAHWNPLFKIVDPPLNHDLKLPLRNDLTLAV